MRPPRVLKGMLGVIHHGNLARSARPQSPHSGESAGLDRAQGQDEAVGDLLLGEPFLMGEAYHLGMGRPTVECLPDDHAVEYLINAVGYRRHVHVFN